MLVRGGRVWILWITGDGTAGLRLKAKANEPLREIRYAEGQPLQTREVQEIAPRCEKTSRGTCAMALVWGGAACYNGHRVGDDFSAIGLVAQLGPKKINNPKPWPSHEEATQ